MRIAFCQMCHKHTPVIELGIGLMSDQGDVFLHVDSKSPMQNFSSLSRKVTFLNDRVDVKWGTYTQVEAMLALFRQTLGGNYDYLVFISGDTLPLRPMSELSCFLGVNHGREFVFEKPLKPEHLRRLRYKYPLSDSREWGLKDKIAHKTKTAFKLYPINPYFHLLQPLHFGSNWVIISSDFRDRILEFMEYNSWFTEAFRYGHCADELFLQTLIHKTDFEPRRDSRRWMWVDWETGPDFPRTLTDEDIPRLADAQKIDTDEEYYLFARKISDSMDLERYVKTLKL